MRSLATRIGAAMAGVMAVTASVPAFSMPIVVAPAQGASQADIIQVQGGPCMGPRCRPGFRPGPGYRPGGPGNWHGYHGYHGPRPGYRRHSDGWWYPLAAFGAGAIIGGAIAGSNREVAPPRGYGSAHYRWCEDRYKSYRASDNTFQPYGGPRQECISPYGP